MTGKGLLTILRAINGNGNSQVNTLYFGGYKISNEDIPNIVAELKKNTTLTDVKLSGITREDRQKIDEALQTKLSTPSETAEVKHEEPPSTTETRTAAAEPLKANLSSNPTGNTAPTAAAPQSSDTQKTEFEQKFEARYSAYSDITKADTLPVSFLCELLEKIYLGSTSDYSFFSMFRNLKKNHVGLVQSFLAENKNETFSDLQSAFNFIRDKIKADLNPKGTLSDILHYCALQYGEEDTFKTRFDSFQRGYVSPQATLSING